MEEKNIDTEVLEMAQTEQQKKEANRAAVKKHYAEKCLEFKVRPQKEEGERIKLYAKENGISVQRLFLEAVRDRMTGTAKGQHTVDLGTDLGENAAMMARAKEMTTEEYVRNAVREQRKRDIQAFNRKP